MRCKSILWLLLSLPGAFGATREEALPAWETAAIQAAVERNIPDRMLWPYFARLCAAIRRAENGGPGREFGVMSKKARTYDEQAGWCAAIAWKRWQEFQTGKHGDDFLVYLASRYAPAGSANDPEGLNRHWLRNVRGWMK